MPVLPTLLVVLEDGWACGGPDKANSTLVVSAGVAYLGARLQDDELTLRLLVDDLGAVRSCSGHLEALGPGLLNIPRRELRVVVGVLPENLSSAVECCQLGVGH